MNALQILPILSALATENVKACDFWLCLLCKPAAMGAHASGRGLRQARTSTASSAGSAGGMVCEAGNTGAA